ncbi:MAG: hypothetical protein ACD_81C00076G0006 [uncultured bacterium]|uniref:Transcription regulator TrmB N-terminal domain-containing protein n=1 Tax=Candidatus Wolfebacteria bacterium GW2011_GWE2_44_13 TaxID=1619017 RepID=A0A0G1JGQ5_9BACT|nr:MAG: hypothetical protein ACD_81C00076G0006 [uncultured bacterium]KKT43182.1 MAG: hypothetical protein UW32_C0002G0043 [Candidatus Wolfebacteria bacterium GW2011_GWE2_44_13]
MDIIKELVRQGLSARKSEVYLAILELGRATTIDIAHKTGIKRTTVYDIVLDLLQMGYITESKKGKRRLFIAEDPSTLLSKNEDRLSSFKELLPFLTEIRNQSTPKPAIRFYDGFVGAKAIMEELLLVEQKEQFFWSSMSDLIDLFGNIYMERWVKRRVKREVISRVLLTNQSKIPEYYLQSNKKVLREIKWLPKEYVFSGVLCIFDNKVAYISSRQESFGFIIESKELAQIMKLIFQSSWMMAPSFDSKPV